ncbi:MAG: phosphatidate cytidylyltransferase [Chloroflexota bacterium]|jgi:phosphatidate cytidylyltransferase|nr:phosphatidate cytidylyltransferase [Chloroflexota bacterium]
MRTRLISAAVLVPVVVILFWLGRPWISLAVALLAILVAWETTRLVRAAGLPANGWLVAVPVLLLIARFELTNSNVTFFYGAPAQVVQFAVVAWATVAALDGLRQKDPRQGFLAWAGTLLAGAYVSLLAFVVGVLTFHVGDESGQGVRWLLLLVLTVWTLDSAAYVVGRYFPRGHFMNHISPKKTWSGAIGGTAAAIVVCTALVVAFGQAVNPAVGVLLGVVIAASAQAGDLAESMIKRAAGAKDSGTLIPGHGGFLDRVDSFMFAAPTMYVTLLLVFASLGVE